MDEMLLGEPNATESTGPDRCAVASSDQRAHMGSCAGPSPADRDRPRSNLQSIAEGHGIPLQVTLTGENCSDVTPRLPLAHSAPTIRGCVAGPGESHGS